MKNIRSLIAILIIMSLAYAPSASAQNIERIARAAGIVPAGCWGGTVEKVICVASRRGQSGRIGSSQGIATPAEARDAYVRIAEWHEINVVVQSNCAPGQSRCGIQSSASSMMTLPAARQMLGLCQNGNRLACSKLVSQAPSYRR